MTTEPYVTVMQHAKVNGWPDEPGRRPRPEDRAYVLPLSKALTREYTTDAHFTAYCAPNDRRLKTTALDHIAVRMDCLVVDVDCEEVHGKGVAAPDSWRADIREKMLALLSTHRGGYYFETRGGSRIVYRQPVPMVIATPEDAQSWKQDYAVTAAYLKRTFEIDADPACADWTRLFRLPRATRKAGSGPEQWPMVGNAANVAPLWFEPSAEDLEEAAKILPRAFEEQKSTRSYEPYLGGGNGLLYYALRNRGHVIRPFKSNAFLIQCPNEAQHTSGKRGDTSTVLFAPTGGQALGMVWCMHGHCQALKAKDWLRFFSTSELDAAREAAGLPPRRAA